MSRRALEAGQAWNAAFPTNGCFRALPGRSLSHAALAETVGASAASVWRRVRNLERSGVLGATVRIADPGRLGRSVNVLRQVQTMDARDEFEKFIQSREEIVDCYAMSGEWDNRFAGTATSSRSHRPCKRSIAPTVVSPYRDRPQQRDTDADGTTLPSGAPLRAEAVRRVEIAVLLLNRSQIGFSLPRPVLALGLCVTSPDGANDHDPAPDRRRLPQA